jgi:hypothetical protein
VGTAPKAYTSLSGVSRQLRNEFHPLFYRGRELLVPYCDLSEVLESLFSKDGVNIAVSQVTVIIAHDDEKTSKEIDLLPLLRATTRNPAVTWAFTRRSEVPQNRSAYPLGSEGRVSSYLSVLGPDYGGLRFEPHISKPSARSQLLKRFRKLRAPDTIPPSPPARSKRGATTTPIHLLLSLFRAITKLPASNIWGTLHPSTFSAISLRQSHDTWAFEVRKVYLEGRKLDGHFNGKVLRLCDTLEALHEGIRRRGIISPSYFLIGEGLGEGGALDVEIKVVDSEGVCGETRLWKKR